MQILKKVFLFLVKILLSLAILSLVFIFIPYKQVFAVIKQAQLLYIFYGFFFFLLCQVFCIWRWQTLLQAIGPKIAIKDVTVAYFLGLFFNIFSPSFVVGDIMRGHTIVKKHGDIKKIASSVLMDRFSATIAVTILGVVAFLLGFNLLPNKSKVFAPLVIISIVSFIAFMFFFSKRVFKFSISFLRKFPNFQNKLVNLHNELYFYKLKPKAFLQSLGLSLIVQILNVISYFMVAKAFSDNTALIYFFIFVPIVTLIALIPITIAGLGTREASMVYFFSIVNMVSTIAVSISLFSVVFLSIAGIIGGLIHVIIYRRRV